MRARLLGWEHAEVGTIVSAGWYTGMRERGLRTVALKEAKTHRSQFLIVAGTELKTVHGCCPQRAFTRSSVEETQIESLPSFLSSGPCSEE